LGRQQNDFQVARLGGDPIEHVHAGESRHHHVQEGHVEALLVQKLERLVSAGRLLHMEAAATKTPRRGSTEICVVIGNQQFDLGWLAQRLSPAGHAARSARARPRRKRANAACAKM
jgi:hypothetical protein